MPDLLTITSSIGVTALIGLAIWQAFKLLRARVDGRHEAQYRRIAEDAVQAQRATEATLAELTSTVTDLRNRLAAVEKILREVG